MPFFASRAWRLLRRLYRPVIGTLAVTGIGAMLWGQRESVALLKQVGIAELASIAALMALNVSVFGARVQLVLQRFLATRISTLWWQRIFVNAFALNSFFPQAGAVYRGVELKRTYDLDVLSYVRGYYFIAWCGVLLILVFGTLALGVLPTASVVQEWNVVLVGAVASIAVAIAPFAVFLLAPHVLPASQWLDKVRAILRDTLDFTTDCLREPRFVLAFVCLSAFTFTGDIVILALSVDALGFDVPLGITVQMFALTSIFGLVRITPGNIGVQELVVGAVGLQAGLTIADGIILSLLTRALRVLAVVFLFSLFNGVSVLRRDAPQQSAL